MGLFWDLIQQSQISEQQSSTATLESRIADLEEQLLRTQDIQRRLLEILEQHLGEDIDGDGSIG